jgi:alkylation response protein AidB-like acyl-CoA dehydrogenase
MSVGLAQACLDASLRYANERIAFGRPIGRFQMLQDMLAEMSVQLDAARLLTYRAAWLIDEGEESLQATATAKYFATEAAKRIADLAVQVHGGLGYMDECAVSRYYRDIRVASIADGSSQIQKLIIGRALGLGESFA